MGSCRLRLRRWFAWGGVAWGLLGRAACLREMCWQEAGVLQGPERLPFLYCLSTLSFLSSLAAATYDVTSTCPDRRWVALLLHPLRAVPCGKPRAFGTLFVRSQGETGNGGQHATARREPESPALARRTLDSVCFPRAGQRAQPRRHEVLFPSGARTPPSAGPHISPHSLTDTCTVGSPAPVTRTAPTARTTSMPPTTLPNTTC